MQTNAFRFLLGALPLALMSAMGPSQQTDAVEVLREDFREVEAHIPAKADDLTCAFIGFERLGPGRDQVKLSFHPNVPDDPHYLWNGLCTGPVLLAFPFAHPLDLTDGDASISLRSKNVGGANLHLAVQCDDRWFVQGAAIPQNEDWSRDRIALHGEAWFALDEDSVVFGEISESPDWGAVTGIGFAAPKKGGGSGSCVRLDWFALHANSARRVQGKRYKIIQENEFGEYFERAVPFVRSALVADEGTRKNRIRRGVLVQSGPRLWACFDPDLLRWAVTWQVPSLGSNPVTLDSMAATSYPGGAAKSNRAPRPGGEMLMWSPELPGINEGDEPASDPRKGRLSDGTTPVGPLPRNKARFSGVSLDSGGAVIEFSVSGTAFQDRVYGGNVSGMTRELRVGASQHTFSLRISPLVGAIDGDSLRLEGESYSHVEIHGAGVRWMTQEQLGTWILIEPGMARRILIVRTAEANDLPGSDKELDTAALQAWDAANQEAWSDRQTATIVRSPLEGKRQGPFQLRDLALPEANASGRAIRPTDIAFTSNGDAWVTTFDGDVWKVMGLEGKAATWVRVASGIYEATNIEVDGSDRIFVLGRDQITQLVDRNGDGSFDYYKNVADGFWQTLHTRDYAMSMVAEPSGSFVVAKGGILRSGQKHGEHSPHRGTILRVSSEHGTQVLADGLRIPYVGRREDGALFASDQQGHWVPSSPLYRIGKSAPSFGFEPTRHRQSGNEPKPAAEPEFWFPYQANRSGAGFGTLDARGFAGLGGQFIHIAWDGRFFAVATPKASAPFGWRLPLQFDFPTLNGVSHPLTGRFYAVGLGLKGYLPLTPRIAGLASVQAIDRCLVPTLFDVQTSEVAVAFRDPVPVGTHVEFVSLRMWNLKRSAGYGSGHYRWDGSAGEMNIPPVRTRLSDDRMRLVIETPPLFRADVAVLHLQVVLPAGAQYPLELYTRPIHLNQGAPTALGQDYRPAPKSLLPGDAALGKQIMTRLACVGCHSLASERLVGPPLNGLKDRQATSIEDHLRESILKPNKIVTPGYPAAMPSYEGVITPQDLEHLITYIRGLK